MFEVSCTSPVIKRVFQCQLSSPPIYKDCVNCVCPGQVKSYQGGVRLDNQNDFCVIGPNILSFLFCCSVKYVS